MKKVNFKINSISFNNGLSINLDLGSITIIVGPNSSGKTTLLREIDEKLRKPDDESYFVKKVEANIKSVEFETLDDHFVNELKLGKEYPYGDPHYNGFEVQIRMYSPKAVVDLKGDVISAFVMFIDTITRLQVIKPTNNISLTGNTYTHPIHYLLRFEELEKQLSDYTRATFEFDIILHTYAGKDICLMVGDRPKLKGNESRFELTQIYDSLTPLEDLGDGVKAYIGVLINLIAAVQKIILIDEPENFLHPPQAKKLGRFICNISKSKEKQIFISTHSSEFLKGLLEMNYHNIQILRITKNHTLNLLENSLCKEIWNDDPIIKSSNILDGLFHDLVIICESDVDVKFYSIILDQISENTLDVLFVPSYGKEKMVKMQKLLRKLRIINRCIIDFDAISDKSFIQSLCKSNDIDFDTIKSNYEPLFQFLKEKDKEDIKRAGKHILSSGLLNNYRELVKVLKGFNIYLVEDGELESFVPSKTGKSSKWLYEVLLNFEKLLKEDEFKNAIEFIKNVLTI